MTSRRDFLIQAGLAASGLTLLGPESLWSKSSLRVPSTTAMLYDPVFLKHDLPGHPESQLRLQHTLDFLEKNGITKKVSMLSSRPATMEEMLRCHSSKYIETLKNRKAGYYSRQKWATYLNEFSFTAAQYAAGGSIELAENVFLGKAKNGFALIRPPGHHAHFDKGAGFCLLNNVALAARNLAVKYNLEKISIIDLDAHHGDGTQSIFYDDPRVQYISIHQEGIFPLSGKKEELGAEKALGTNVNIPVPLLTGDQSYLEILEVVIIPLVRRFKPQIIFVSFGSDTHWRDYNSVLNVTCTGIFEMARKIKIMSDGLCGGKVVYFLEGGYNLQALSEGVANCLLVLSGSGIKPYDSLGKSDAQSPAIGQILKEIRSIHSLS